MKSSWLAACVTGSKNCVVMEGELDKNSKDDVGSAKMVSQLGFAYHTLWSMDACQVPTNVIRYL